MRPVSETFEDIRRYLKERGGEGHDSDYWERQAHFDHLEGMINAELDIKTIISWLDNGMKKYKGAIPYLSSQRYYNYLQELHQVFNGSDPTIALFLKHLSIDQVAHAMKASITSGRNFADELVSSALTDQQKLQKIFIFALQERDISAVKLLLKYKIEITEEIYFSAKKTDDERIYQYVVQPYHDRKKQLLQEGPVQSIIREEEKNPGVMQALLSRTFAETAEKKSMIRRGMTEMAKQPLLQDVLAIAALAAVGKHDQGLARDKQLTVVLAEDLKSFVALNRPVMGIYNAKNSVYVNSKHDVATMPILAHEITHFVAGEVFKNGENPYRRDDSINKQNFAEIVAASKAVLKQLPKNNREMILAAAALEEVYEYSEDKWALELIVRVPQIIALLGNEEGSNWLNEYFPKLLDYYEKVFIPSCKQYLIEHHADQFLDLPSPKEPSSTLKT